MFFANKKDEQCAFPELLSINLAGGLCGRIASPYLRLHSRSHHKLSVKLCYNSLDLRGDVRRGGGRLESVFETIFNGQ